MTTTTRIIIAVAIFVFTSSAVAQEAKQAPNGGRYIVTARDSAGTRIYTRWPEGVLPFKFNDAPFDTIKVNRNWSKMKKGLSENEVERLLGRCSGIQTDPRNALSYWWYGRRAVVFNSVTKKVSFCDK
ncbi:MAG: hypothetical protein Q8P51_18065 [Ignavibacteria bacterium]|nr:hypothetical protein [Ignavibacteria bacterium]